MTAPASTEARSQLVSLSQAEIGEIAAFIAAQSGRERESVETHLRWFLLENPARQPEEPLGFGLRSADQLVGCILLSPQLFRLEAREILFMGSSSFYVDRRHRGQGGRIFLQYCRLARQHPLFGTSANAEAAALWKAAGARPIPYSDCEFLGVLHWPAVAEEFAHRRYANKTVSRLAGSAVANIAGLMRALKIDGDAVNDLQPLSSADEASELCTHKPSSKLTARRDASYLHWRYFSGHDPTAAVFAFRSSKPDQDVLVAVNRRQRGYRNQISVLNVLDIYPEVSAQEWLRIIGALILRYRKVIDAVVLRNLDSELQEAFAAKGFQRRVFEAPIGWYLDKSSPLRDCEWYPVPADGDSLI
jgi:GNAT superfamily N-acetyltransferase